MSSLSLAVRDSSTMLRRNLLHARRYPSLTLNLLLTPIMLLVALRLHLRRHDQLGHRRQSDRSAGTSRTSSRACC